MKTILLVILIAISIGCNNQNSSQKVTIAPNESQKTDEHKVIIPDTIKTLAGFIVGMTEDEIRKMVKNYPKKYYKDPQLVMPMICTKIDGRSYIVAPQLYRGKLTEISYNEKNGFKKIDDPELKSHYRNICNELKDLNKNSTLSNVYYNKFKEEWPYSSGTDDMIIMAELNTSSGDIFGDKFTIYLSRDDNHKYSLTIAFRAKSEGNYESTLSKFIYYDEL
jgi:hypothetical protein